MNKSAATFPSLDVSEIVETCRSYGCPISEEDVLRPTPGTVQSTLEWWMQRILGLNTEDCLKAASNQLDHMEHSDIYKDMIFICVFQSALDQLLKSAAIEDFTTKDLTAPTTTRFRSTLSGIINFFLFEQEQASEYLEPMQEEDEALILEEEKLIKMNMLMREEIEAIREERRLNEPKTLLAEQAHEVLLAEIKKQKMTSQSLASKVEAEKLEMRRISEATARIAESNNLQLKEITRVQLQVIKSPERVRSTLSDMAATLARETEAVKIVEAKERLMSNKISILAKYEGDLGSCIKILSDWQIDVDRATKASDKYQSLYDQFESLKIEMAETKGEIARLERRIAMSNESIDRFLSKTEEKRARAHIKEMELKEAHSELLDQKRKFDHKASEKTKEAVEVENQIKAINEDFQIEMEKGESAFRKIRDQVQLYSIKINKALDSINSMNAQSIDLSSR